MGIANLLWRRGAQVSSTGLKKAWRMRLAAGAGLLAAGLLMGCTQGGGASGAAAALGSNTGASAPVSAPHHVTARLQGAVHGGQPPIGGSAVSVYAAGNSGAAPVLLTPQAATTAANGTFTFASFECPAATDLIYVVASGGAQNAASAVSTPIKLMAALGPCGKLPSSIVINELTTVAAVYALNAFATVTSGSGLSGCVDCTPSSSLGDMTQLQGNSTAMTNSFATAALLANVTTGGLGTYLPPAASCLPEAGAPVNCSAVQQLTGLANSLAGCVSSVTSTGTGGGACTSLFKYATGTSTINIPTPTDTLEATLAIARYPGLVNIASIYALAPAKVVFAPGLAAVPNDWTIALNFTNTNLSGLQGIAIDAAGNAWVTSTSPLGATNPGLIELSPTGVVLGGALQLLSARDIAIDMTGKVWVTDDGGSSVSAFDPTTGTSTTTPQFYGGLNTPTGIAIDASGNVWIANFNMTSTATYGSLTELTVGAAGALEAAPGSPFTGGGLAGNAEYLPPYGFGVAIDASGHVWVSNPGSANDVAEFAASSGAPLSGAGFTVGGLGGIYSSPAAIAVDASGHVWVADAGTASVTELTTASGSALSGSNGFSNGGLSPGSLAVDGAGNVWTAGGGFNSTEGTNFYGVAELNSAGQLQSPPASGFVGPGLLGPAAIAIDESGDVWVANFGAYSGLTSITGSGVTEFIGAAVPVVTPLVARITPPASPLTAVEVTPASPPNITAPATYQFTATGTYADGSTANLTAIATWSSSNTPVATIAAGGVATAVAAGTTIISASVTQNGTTVTSSPSGNATLSVTAATSTTSNVLAIAMAGVIQVFNVSGSWNTSASTNATPTAFANVSATGVTSVAFDSSNNLYYVAAGSTSVSFNKCAAPAYSPCSVVGASLPAGSEWLAIDTNGNGYVTETNTVIQFPLASGPSANNSVAFTSNMYPDGPANFTGLTVSPGTSPTLYVVQGGGTGYGTSSRLYQCVLPCSVSGPTDITTQVLLATGTNATIFGPIAVGPPPASSLYVATGNAWGNSSGGVVFPNAAPIALICPSTIATSGSCIVAAFPFPSVGSYAGDNVDPFVGSAGIAADSTGNAYVAVAQAGTPLSAPNFFGFQSNGSLFGCTTIAPQNCPVNLLPSIAALSPLSPDVNLPYTMAIGPAGQ